MIKFVQHSRLCLIQARSDNQNFNLALKYGFFAAIATCVNIISQYIVLRFLLWKYAIYAALLVGTAAGLITKYYLDKKFIFYYKTQNIREDIGKFFLYSAIGAITTIIFWGFELGFDYLFKFESAKFIGAVIGLMIGYFVKYNLDKKFVFINEETENL